MGLVTHRTDMNCDVLVVGAGPAGAVAAGLLARQGWSVTVLEKHAVPRGKLCGDLIGPRTLSVLKSLDLLDLAVEARGRVVDEIRIFDERRLVGWGSLSRDGGGAGFGHGLALERAALDASLRDRACLAGAELLQGVRFTRIESQDETGIRSTALSDRGEIRFRSRLILGADGVHSSVARQIGLSRRNPAKMILGVRCYYAGVPDPSGALELYFDRALFPGYGWLIPLGEGRANVGVGIRADVCARRGRSVRSLFHRFVETHPDLSRRLARARRLGKVEGWPIGLYGQALKNYGSHVLLLGDAGNFVDPLSGEGVYGAVESARLAAATSEEALRAGRFDAEFLSRYEARWRSRFEEDFGLADRLVSLPYHIRSLSSLALWAIRRMCRRGIRSSAYANKVTGFFSGTIPRKAALRVDFILETLLG
jgi:geranylgeranyl reductase family protein